ncbi:MAG: hypothetical protein ACYC6Y_00720, partial [Thermoguttaceae bacterium]
MDCRTGHRTGERALPGEPIGPAALSGDGRWLALRDRRGTDPLSALVAAPWGLSSENLDVLVEPLDGGAPGQAIAGPSTPGEGACAFSPD